MVSSTSRQELRRKQIHGIPFYRQRPIGDFIVDFYSPRARLVIEVDGGQHWETLHRERDQSRDRELRRKGLTVLRFSNLDVLQQIDAVVARISSEVEGSR